MNEIDKFFSQFIGQSQGQGRFLRLSVEDNLVGGTFIGRKDNQDYLKVEIDGLTQSSGGGVKSVTGLNTNNTDPLNPIVQISVDGTTITGDGTPSSPLVATSGTPITPAALSRTNDTNVTATLTGTVSTALLQAVNIALGWTGLLSIARGGTNSGTALSNNRIMQSSGNAIVEATAITPARVLISDANGIPTHSSVTDTTLGYLDATSSIQTQINIRRKSFTTAALGTTISGTLNTYCNGILIPAGTYTSGSVLVLTANPLKAGVVGTLTARFYANTTNDLVGSPVLLGTSPVSAAAFRTFTFQRILAVVVQDGTGTGTSVTDNTAGQVNDFTQRLNANSSVAVNWNNDVYLIIALQLSSGTDNGNCRYMLVN
jgi:hypothetical protein